MPYFERPMLATLTESYFSDKEWIFERKFDGVRGLLFKDGKEVFLKSRNNNYMDMSYPEIITAGKKLKVDQIILDGEIVAFEGSHTSFQKLQLRIGITKSEKIALINLPIYMYIFDILYLDGHDLTQLPLEDRKCILKACIKYIDPLRYTEHKDTNGIEFYKQACAKGWEGLIAKKRDSIYVHKRSKAWLKFKCVSEQEFVIAGYTDPQRSRIGFGALLLGYYKNNKFHYAGKVGTGFDDAFLTEFSQKLKRFKIKKNPFTSHDVPKDVYFVKPVFVAQIGFEEWTKDGKLRHPRFLGLRTDKKPKEVEKEIAKSKKK